MTGSMMTREEVVDELQEWEERYRRIFEATRDGLVITALNGVIVEANPAYCLMRGYTSEELTGRNARDLVHPEDRHYFDEYLRAVQDGRSYQARARLLRKDGTTFPVEVHGTGFIYKGTLHALAVTRDVTERVTAEEALRASEIRYRTMIEQSPRSIQIFTADGRTIQVNRAWENLWGLTLDQLDGYNILEDQQLVEAGAMPLIKRGFEGEACSIPAIKYEPDKTIPGADLGRYQWTSGFIYPIKDERGSVREVVLMHEDVTERIQAYELLEQRVRERTHELSTLLEVSHNVASTLELQPLVGLILDQLKTLVDYTGVAVFLVEGEHLRILDYRGPLPVAQVRGLQISTEQAPGYQAVVQRDGPVIVDDLRGVDPLAQALKGLPGHLAATLQGAESLLVVPLKTKDVVIGVVRIEHRERHAYTAQHAVLALAVANQAAVAIENARLYARAQEVATLEERQRLARELHDSVTQALYGVTLYAEAATSRLEAGEHETATAYLRDVRETAQDALQEMRLLIFELRPPLLEQEGLAAALRSRLSSVEGRIGDLSASLDVQGEIRLSRAMEEALYGIAQESLNNIFKHAKAHSIGVSLRVDGQIVVMEIVDDGVGFDRTATQRSGGLGLLGMQERVAKVGGSLSIQTQVGHGTLLHVEAPL